MAEINKKILQHLADLSRIELDPQKEDKFLIDFKSILGHFDEIQRLGVRMGETVIVTRAGDSIQKITNLLKELRPNITKE